MGRSVLCQEAQLAEASSGPLRGGLLFSTFGAQTRTHSLLDGLLNESRASRPRLPLPDFEHRSSFAERLAQARPALLWGLSEGDAYFIRMSSEAAEDASRNRGLVRSSRAFVRGYPCPRLACDATRTVTYDLSKSLSTPCTEPPKGHITCQSSR